MPFGFRGICHFDTDRGRRDDRGHDYHEDSGAFGTKVTVDNTGCMWAAYFRAGSMWYSEETAVTETVACE